MAGKPKRGSTVLIGVWIWGAVAAMLAAVIFIVVLTGKPAELYGRFKDSATALGAIVAAGALAWSHFFTAVGKQDVEHQLADINHKLDDLNKRWK